MVRSQRALIILPTGAPEMDKPTPIQGAGAMAVRSIGRELPQEGRCALLPGFWFQCLLDGLQQAAPL